jgi:hypothetical protein
VDVEEQKMIDQLRFEVRVADQRLAKEKREYEEWAQMAQKEVLSFDHLHCCQYNQSNQPTCTVNDDNVIIYMYVYSIY